VAAFTLLTYFTLLTAELGEHGERLAGHGAPQVSQVHRSTLGHRPRRHRVLPLPAQRRRRNYYGAEEHRSAASVDRQQRLDEQQITESQVDGGNVDVRSSSERRQHCVVSRQLACQET